jgi:hypothetical protein
LFITAFRNQNFFEISAMIFGIVFSFVFFIIVYKILHNTEVKLEFSKLKSGQEYLNSVVGVQQQSADLAKKEPDTKSIKGREASASLAEYSENVIARLKEDRFKLSILLILLLAIPITWHYFRTLPVQEVSESTSCWSVENGNYSANGPLKYYYESGQLQGEGTCKNNKREGPAKVYYESGQLKEEWIFKNDKEEGLDKMYYEGGQLKAERIYKNGKLEGPAKVYRESGELILEGTLKDGKQDGPSKAYYESGQLQEDGIYKDGKKEGKFKLYRWDGTIEYIDTYKNGEQINRKAFDVEGRLLFDQDY